MKFFVSLVAVVLLTESQLAFAAVDVLVDALSANWRYMDDGANQDKVWRDRVFNDSGWNIGVGVMGYGYSPDELGTEIAKGPVGSQFITSYYRSTFEVSDPAAYKDIDLGVFRDDGLVVYINGKEVLRNNMPATAVDFMTLASNEVSANTLWETGYQEKIPTKYLRKGTNVVAVELHQFNRESTKAVFALQMSANTVLSADDVFTRGPYLQMITPTSAFVRWETVNNSNSVVRFGKAANNLDNVIKSSERVQHHQVQLTGLDPDTKYYYSAGSGKQVIGSGTGYFFKTQPSVGAAQPTRIWVIGDSGRGNQAQRDVYDGFKAFAGNRYTDLWLMLGDNAYGNGHYQEYQDKFFKIYPELLRQTVVWPTLGNHDGHSVDTPAQTGPYYEVFTLPKAAEAGGVASGTEAYYSYNYGNIHFVVLDAYDVDRSASGVMAQWLEADLAANAQDWVIAYWHHPPYTKGTHDSDAEIELIEMRENILPILEQHGVDLVLTGHSHNYERSKFVNGHYGYSNTYSDGLFALDIGSGDVSRGDQAYTKAHPAIANGGTVYAVAGTSATAEGGAMDHPVMYRSFSKLGSMILDVDNLLLSAKFIDVYGDVQDEFTIQKLNAGPDRDGDDVLDIADNCIVNANPDQHDADADSLGDVCDGGTDTDGDGIGDSVDVNDDNDALDDVADNCQLIANNNQKDYDVNSRGDVCDPLPMRDFLGYANKDNTGASLAFAGDVDADGYGDYVVGMPGYDVAIAAMKKIRKNAGRAVVISGKTGRALMSFNGAMAGDAAGFSVAGGGDVNDDGYDDVIVGAPYANASGSATVLFGPDGANAHTFFGAQTNAQAGAAVALGDVNGDSHADIVFGSPKADHWSKSLSEAGSVSMIDGATLNPFPVVFYGSVAKAHAGLAVDVADVDGVPGGEIIIGAPDDDDAAGAKDAGSVAIYKYNHATTNVIPKMFGAKAKAHFGKSLATGMLDGDLKADIFVGAPGDDSAAIIFADGSASIRKISTSAKTGFGNGVAVGDINGDSFADIIVGASKDDMPSATPVKDAGSVSVWYGPDFDVQAKLYGASRQDHFGADLGAGDINGDGAVEAIIGVPGQDIKQPFAFKNVGGVQIQSGQAF